MLSTLLLAHSALGSFRCINNTFIEICTFKSGTFEDNWIPDSFTNHFIPEGLFVGRVFGPAHSQISDLRLNWVGCITTAYFPFCYTLTSKKMHFMLSSPHLNFIMSAYLVSLKVESLSASNYSTFCSHQAL